ncbi:PDCD5-related protein [Syncephalis fuscata]|nr:PDCD5-related protein [Syncephalis fuscata]
MDDNELQAIRARRLAELQAQRGAGSASGSQPGGFTGGSNDAEGDDEAKRSQAEEMRRTMLSQILNNEARERLARIAMVKPDKARAMEDLLIRMARGGQLRGQITEKQLVELLENINQQAPTQSKIVYNRRREVDSDEDDWDL